MTAINCRVSQNALFLLRARSTNQPARSRHLTAAAINNNRLEFYERNWREIKIKLRKAKNSFLRRRPQTGGLRLTRFREF